MNITHVRVGVSLTIPVPGTYGNIKPSAELEADLEPGEDAATVHTILYQKAKTFVMRQAIDLGEDFGVILDKGLDNYLQNFFELGKS